MARIRNAISLKLLATPPGFEPGTFSLEGAWSHNDFNARSDIFTFRAPFEAVIEFRFVGMPISAPHVTEETAPGDRTTTDAETPAHLKRSSALVISTQLRWGWSGSATALPGMRSGTRSGHAGMRSDMRPCNPKRIRIYIRI
jgi:hypothetical protein